MVRNCSPENLCRYEQYRRSGFSGEQSRSHAPEKPELLRYAFSFPQHVLPGFFQHPPSKTEGAGKTGRPMRPQPRVQSKKAHELVTTGHRIDPAFPAQWF
jgi:hypothetical protein